MDFMRTGCTDFARKCTPFPALFCMDMQFGDERHQPLIQKLSGFIEYFGGRTRDRTLDLSRVKGTLSR
jgi:hypothetical protein